MSGLVVAAHPAGAEAGAALLAAGGSAMDAAVAAAFALGVLEPAQCGVGGYGGFLTYAPAGAAPFQVCFDTWAPARLPAEAIGGVLGGDTSLPDGGAAVAPPAVVPGLLAAHARAGRRPLAEVLGPAVRLARQGFRVGAELATALSDHHARTGGGSREFARIFFPDGRPPAEGAVLVQEDLARTLESIPDGSFRGGPLVDAVCAAVTGDGGFLAPEDFAEDRTIVCPAARQEYESATVFGPDEQFCGTGVLFPALAAIDPDRLADNRGASYLGELARALRAAWAARARQVLGDLEATHTTHLCAADAEGSIASLTFTHGRRRFGSGLVAPGTGVVLNAGVGLFAPGRPDARAVTNMTPVVVEEADGTRHALGAVGGPRIPAVVLTSVVDVVHYGMPLGETFAAPHLAVRPTDGTLQAEDALVEAEAAEGWSRLEPGEAFGPACGVTSSPGGRLVAATDPRFEIGVAGSAS